MPDEHGRDEPAEVEAAERAAEKCRAAEAQAFKAKLAKRLPPGEVDRAEIDKARKRTKARPPSIAMSIEDRGTEGCVIIPNSQSVRSADQEREALPITSDQEGALSTTRRRKR